MGQSSVGLPGACRVGRGKHWYETTGTQTNQQQGLRDLSLSSSGAKHLAKARELLYQPLQERIPTPTWFFSAYFYGFRGKLVICFEGCKVYTQTEVFQEAQQAAVAKAFLPPCLLNATESEKARHKIRLSIKTIPLLNSLSSPRSTSISKITYDHKQQDCNIQVPG